MIRERGEQSRVRGMGAAVVTPTRRTLLPSPLYAQSQWGWVTAYCIVPSKLECPRWVIGLTDVTPVSTILGRATLRHSA